MEALRKLLCGKLPPRPNVGYSEDFLQAIDGLGALVEDYGVFAKQFKDKPAEKLASYFGPLAARSLMEASCSVLLARLDPMRVIYSARAQGAANYDRGRSQASSIRWKGDIVVQDYVQPPAVAVGPQQPANPAPQAPAPGVQAAPAQMQPAPQQPQARDGGGGPAAPQGASRVPKAAWDPNKDATKLPRALLCAHYCEIIWSPAVQALSDWQGQANKQSAWLGELVGVAPEDISVELPAVGNRVYSELSKGIHPEFIVRRQTVFDEATLETLLTDTVGWVAKIGLLSHFCRAINLGHDADEAYELFVLVEQAMA